jgi:hypothetical protein
MTFRSDLMAISFGEESTYGTKPASIDTWIGLVPRASFPTKSNEAREWWAIGEGRDFFGQADGIAVLEGSIPFVLQNGYMMFFVLGYVVDTGTDVGGGGGSDLDGALAVGDTSITLTDATNYAVDDYIQIGVANAEIRKITNIAGAPTIVVDKGVRRIHADAETCNEVQAPFTHVMQNLNTLPNLGSFTLEGKYFDGTTTFVRWAQGCKIDSFTLEATEEDVLIATADVITKIDTKDTSTSTTLTAKTDEPYKFYEAAWTVDGSGFTKVTSFRQTINSALRPKRYMQSTNGQYIYELIEGKRTHELQMTAVIDDTTLYDLILDGSIFDAYVIFTRGANDTLRIDFDDCKILTGPHDIPEEGEVVVENRIRCRRTKYTFVDSNPYY